MTAFNRYPLWWIIGQNVLFAAFFALGAWGIAYISLVTAVLYILSVVVMLGVLLRRELCTHCPYYGGLCGTGWGWWASQLFRKESGNYKRGLTMAAAFWTVSMLLAGAMLATAVVLKPSATRIIHFVALFLLGAGIFFVHKETCRRCRNAPQCPASMVKVKVKPSRPPSNE